MFKSTIFQRYLVEIEFTPKAIEYAQSFPKASDSQVIKELKKT
jgi:hypothetical protein